MIDLGVSKLILIGIVALVVIGPERLPGVARTLGALLGRARCYVNLLKAEVRGELEDQALTKLKQDFLQAQHAVKQKIEHLSMATLDVSALTSNGQIDAKRDISSGMSIYSAQTAKPRLRIATWRLRQAMLPKWFKHHIGVRSQLRSGAARVKRYRPASRIKRDFFNID